MDRADLNCLKKKNTWCRHMGLQKHMHMQQMTVFICVDPKSRNPPKSRQPSHPVTPKHLLPVWQRPENSTKCHRCCGTTSKMPGGIWYIHKFLQLYLSMMSPLFAVTGSFCSSFQWEKIHEKKEMNLNPILDSTANPCILASFKCFLADQVHHSSHRGGNLKGGFSQITKNI